MIPMNIYIFRSDYSIFVPIISFYRPCFQLIHHLVPHASCSILFFVFSVFSRNDTKFNAKKIVTHPALVCISLQKEIGSVFLFVFFFFTFFSIFHTTAFFSVTYFGFSNGFTHQKNELPSTQRLLKPNYVIRNAQSAIA